MTSPYEAAQAAADVVAKLTGVERHPVAVVLGSGWGDAAPQLGTVTWEGTLTDIPGIPRPTVAGHRGRLLSVDANGVPVLVFAGRSHLYEGHPVDTVVHGVRTAILGGCETVILTNAAGGIDPAVPVGTPVLVRDHLNLTGASPMVGPDPPPGFPVRFCDLTDAYDPDLRALARRVDPTVPEGVYAGLLGGNYETPAEIHALATLGADLVGMSTVLETIAARHLGARVLGVSLVTNMAAGVTAEKLDHLEVLAEGKAAAPRMVALLRGVLAGLGRAQPMIAQLGTILGVWAHPDDECYLSGGLMAATVHAGQRVVCVTATRGEMADPDRWPPEEMARIREAELDACLAVLGVREHHWLDYPDGGCAAVDADEAVARVAAIIAEVRPDTVLTFGPDGMTGHPDHCTVSAWTARAVSVAGTGAALYFATHTPEWADRFDITAPGVDVMMDDDMVFPFTPASEIAINLPLDAELLALKERAMLEQATQVEQLRATMGDARYRELLVEEVFRRA